MKKNKRKVPQSVKVRRRIDAEVKASFLQAVPVSTAQGLLVSNKSKSWAWFSNIAFALIVAVQAFFDTLPPELIATLPVDAQSKITMALAILGVVGRFINQSRQTKPLLKVGDQ